MPYITSVERIGYDRCLNEGLHKAFEVGLELRFGAEGLALMPQMRQFQEPERLRQLVEVVKTATTLDDVRQALA